MLVEKWEDAVKAINQSHKDTIFDAEIGWLFLLYYYCSKIFYCNDLFTGNILLFWYTQTMYNNQIAVLGISVSSNINSFYVCGILFVLWGKIDCSHRCSPYCPVEARTSFLPIPGLMWIEVQLGTPRCSPSALGWKETSLSTSRCGYWQKRCYLSRWVPRSTISIFDIFWRR